MRRMNDAKTETTTLTVSSFISEILPTASRQRLSDSQT